MNSQRKFNKLLLLLGVMLLFGVSAICLGLLPDRSLVWLKPAQSLLATKLEEREKARLEDRDHAPDQPDEAIKFRRLQMQDENGFVPPDGPQKARQHVALMKIAQQERIKARQQSGQKSPPGPEAAGIEPDSWSWIGPGNVGGRIRSIVIHPTNTNTMWVGSVTGGIWRTDNGGASWQPVNDFMANLAVSAMVINPTNSNIMYAGTGEGVVPFNNGNDDTLLDAVRGAGVFQSTDGGVTWNQLASTANNNWFFVNRLAISPTGNAILAATNTGIWRSTSGGAMWTQGTTTQAIDIDFHPTNSNQAVEGEMGNAQYSTDGGQTWTAATFRAGTTVITISGRVEVAYAPSNPSIVYASVDRNQGEIYKSTDGGQNYTRVNAGYNYLDGQGWYDNIIWVNPRDPNFVVVGGIDLWRSTNGGTNLIQISGWQNAPRSAHADHHMIVAHPGFNNTTNLTVFFGNDGGIYRTDNITNVGFDIWREFGWVELNNNLGITQFYGAAGNSTGMIIGGTQDNGTVRYTGGTESWNTPAGASGDGGFCAADPTDPDFLYGEYINLTIYRSMDRGLSFQDIYSGISDAKNGANFIAPFILDPNNPNTMLAGGRSLWRSTNVKIPFPFGPTWAAIKAPTTGNSPISAIAVSPGNSNFICVGHNNGDIYLSSNGTSNPPAWTKIDIAALPDRFVTRLAIDSTRSPNWIYVTFGGFNGDNIYRTTNSGATWTDVTGAGATGLPDVPVRSLVFHPRNPNFLYAGTEVGVFTSEDAGATWELPQDGPANVSVDELFWLAGDLIAATHGRGLYRASGGIYVNCKYTGRDERGTFDQPFKTVTAAVNAVTTYRAIWIGGDCNYNETIPPTNKRLELRSFGGAATIGRP